MAHGVDQRGNCWLWTGKLNLTGYGKFWGVQDGVGFNVAHRFSYHIHYGPVPSGLLCLHSCDNRWCVNPEHLRVGTQTENQAESKAKGRAAIGSLHGNSKLTEKQARFAKESKISPNVLGARWDIHPSVITKIRTGVNWKHI